MDGQLQGIATAAREAHAETDKSNICYELDRTAELTDVLHARLAQLEDRLGPVRSPLVNAEMIDGAPVPPVSPVAEQIRTIGFGLRRAIARLDTLLSDIEL